MNAVNPRTAATTQAVSCAHCGLPVPSGLLRLSAKGAPEGPQFCCNGCKAVYALMADSGLDQFYALRDGMGSAARGQAADTAATEIGAEAYAHYDDEAFLGRHARVGSDGRCSIELFADGVHCAACVWVMERLPQVVPGVTHARLAFAEQRLSLEWDPAQTSLGHVAAFLHRLGYPTHPPGAEADKARKRRARADLIRLAVTFALAGNVMLLAIALYAAGAHGGAGETAMDPTMSRFFEWLSFGLTVPAVTYGAWPFFRSALSGLKVGRAHMDLPVSLGLIGGFVASTWALFSGEGAIYFDSVALLVFLLLAGRYVQTRGQQAAMNGTELMGALTPGTAWRQAASPEGATWVATPVTALTPGDVVRVRAGEVMPVDGHVIAGATQVDASLLTGESRPVPAEVGAHVHAGTVNIDDEISVQVETSGDETRLGRLARLIDEAGAERAPLVQAADRIAGIFVSVVILLAVAGGVTWWFIDPSRVFDVVVGLLVVSCPCALGLATPVALAVARGRAARAGVLVRSTAALERLARVDHVVLDKTGTLTEGRLVVVEAWLDPRLDEAEQAQVRQGLAALERRSNHPTARAISTWAADASADAHAPDAFHLVEIARVSERPGQGIEGLVDGVIWRVGRAGWADTRARMAPALDQARAKALGRRASPVMVRRADQVVAVLALADQIRPDTPEALRQMRQMGLSLEVQSGDHPAVVDQVARHLGLDDAHGAASPEDKAHAVARTRHQDAPGPTAPGLTAMVGDGINDAPALRAAGVGVAVAGGAEAALQVADVYLDRPGLTAVAEVFTGARRALAIVRRNLWFSLLYNLTFATLALAGFITPLAAAVLMPISSLTVVASSVMGRTFTNPRSETPR